MPPLNHCLFVFVVALHFMLSIKFLSLFLQVDRSGAYAARWIAKSLVAAGLCRRALVQVSYAIGIAEPLSITVFSYGTSKKSEDELLKIVKDNFDLRPGMIVK